MTKKVVVGSFLILPWLPHLLRQGTDQNYDYHFHLFISSVTFWFLDPLAVLLKLVVDQDVLIGGAVLALLGKLPGQSSCQVNVWSSSTNEHHLGYKSPQQHQHQLT